MNETIVKVKDYSKKQIKPGSEIIIPMKEKKEERLSACLFS